MDEKKSTRGECASDKSESFVYQFIDDARREITKKEEEMRGKKSKRKIIALINYEKYFNGWLLRNYQRDIKMRFLKSVLSFIKMPIYDG